MRKLKMYMTYGLPASGKSSWAKAKLSDQGEGTIIRVNNDEIRAMMHNSRWSKHNEKQVGRIRELIIADGIANKQDIIIDNTNLNPKYERMYKLLAQGAGYDFIKVDFSNVPLSECIKRDADRQHYVGERVIRKMYLQYLAGHEIEPMPVFHKEGAPKAIIVDIDGTVAQSTGRSPYDLTKVSEDVEIKHVVDLVKREYAAGFKIIFVSGRDASAYADTVEWLISILGPEISFILLMRPEGDTRPDYTIKREIFLENINGKYKVEYVLDDRSQVVELCWRALGIPCFQVAEGEF